MLSPSIRLHGNSDLRDIIFLRKKQTGYSPILYGYQLSNKVEFYLG